MKTEDTGVSFHEWLQHFCGHNTTAVPLLSNNDQNKSVAGEITPWKPRVQLHKKYKHCD